MTTRTAALFIVFVLLAFGMVVYDNIEGRKELLKVEKEADSLSILLISTHAQKMRAEREVQLLTLKLKICELQTRIILEKCQARNETTPDAPSVFARGSAPPTRGNLPSRGVGLGLPSEGKNRKRGVCSPQIHQSR